jgi:hypothetical protein
MLLAAALFSIGNINNACAIGDASTNGEWEYTMGPLMGLAIHCQLNRRKEMSRPQCGNISQQPVVGDNT